MIVFQRLWETMREKEISRYRLIRAVHFSTGQLDRLRRGWYFSTYALDQLCWILDCKLEEIAEYQTETDAGAGISPAPFSFS